MNDINMKQVKIFTDCWATAIEHEVNNFCKNHKVVDIQYRIISAAVACTTYSVMIVYEEE